jgi:hypothetical protein
LARGEERIRDVEATLLGHAWQTGGEGGEPFWKPMSQ